MTDSLLVKFWQGLKDIFHNSLPVPSCRQHKWEWIVSKQGGCYHCSVCGKWAGHDNGSWIAW